MHGDRTEKLLIAALILVVGLWVALTIWSLLT